MVQAENDAHPSRASRSGTIRAGYSKDTARQMGSELLGKALVSDAIARLKAERSDLTKVDAAYVLHRLYDENEADLADLFADNGALLDAADMPLICSGRMLDGASRCRIVVEGELPCQNLTRSARIGLGGGCSPALPSSIASPL